jgi:membrane-associated protease RseP (regulator of RpoE activity)
MRGVDVSRFDFDTDLTFAALLVHPDGHVYHRYGGRDHRSASLWLSSASFESVLRETLAEHAAYAADPDPPTLAAPVRTEALPAFAKKDRGECIHCHSVRPTIAAKAVADGTWRATDIWRHPPPSRIGLDLDRDEQRRITAVATGSIAERGGLEAGDRIDALGEQRILTMSDVSFVLDRMPVEGGTLVVHYRRDGEARSGELELPSGWKIGTPLEYSWRPFKWELMPRVGFGGEDLGDADKVPLGLQPGDFAFRVTYLVDWGDFKRFGEAVERAGLEKDDVVVGAGGGSHFAGEAHFQAWYRLTHEPGDRVPIEVLRDGERRTLTITVPE